VNENSTFSVHHLRFEVETVTPLALPPPAGPKLRAALYQALGMVCPLRGDANAPPEHKAACPVCWLLATEKPGDRGGKDLPRPVTLEPPLDLKRGKMEPGERFSFGLSLFAQAANLFPYLALGVPEMGRRGLGRRLPELKGERGRFTLRRAEAVNPLTQERQLLLDAAQGPLFQTPSIPVTEAQVSESASQRVSESANQRVSESANQRVSEGAGVGIEFLTPTRIVREGRLVHRPLFAPLFARLLGRLRALSTHYADGTLVPDGARPGLMALAEQVRLVRGPGEWDDSRSYSHRLGRSTPMGGFVGKALYQAPPDVWRPLLPYLLWGQSTHVGKSATKGNGWYRVSEWAKERMGERANERMSE
jgi:hypothetical protein